MDEGTQRSAGEISILAIDRLDARAVHSQKLTAKQIELAAQQHKFPEYRPEGRAVVAPEIGDRLEVRPQVPQQPDHFEIAIGLRLQPAARSHPVQISVDVELQKVARRIARTTGRLRHDTGKPGGGKNADRILQGLPGWEPIAPAPQETR